MSKRLVNPRAVNAPNDKPPVRKPRGDGSLARSITEGYPNLPEDQRVKSKPVKVTY